MKWLKNIFKRKLHKYDISVFDGNCYLLGKTRCIVSYKWQLKEIAETLLLEVGQFYTGENKDELYYIYEEVE
jgi:hypothetical protein